MINLANAYSDRIRGDRAENLEPPSPPTASPGGDDPPGHARRVGASHDEPGERLRDRIRGDRRRTWKQAIDAYRQALQVRTRQAMPVEWARAMMNLATAYP